MKAYGALALTVASPEQTFAEPLTLVDVKTMLKLPLANNAEDPWLLSLITAARGVAEIEQGGIDLSGKQYDLNLDFLVGDDVINSADQFRSFFMFGVDNGIGLRFPLNSVDLFRTTDNNGTETTLQEGRTSDYVVDLNRARVVPPWGQIWPFYTPDASSSVLIRFTSGYSPMHPFWKDGRGHMILQGMRMLITLWYENRFPVGGDVSEYPYGVTMMLRYGARPRVC